ncbi:hypothetical protein WP50_18050 [Lactiplantibacillus plantarum]|nr:hypothetical protein WP50_18050 [Lactiplantibacillus plantarum]
MTTDFSIGQLAQLFDIPVATLRYYDEIGLLQGLAFIAGIDRLVDMGRTVVNVVGNSLAAVIIGKSEHEFDTAKSDQYLAEIRAGHARAITK